MAIEVNLKANRIGTITAKDLYKFKLALDETTQRYQVIGIKDGHVWGDGASTKGAVISACNCGCQLKDIDIREAWVPLKEVISAIKG